MSESVGVVSDTDVLEIQEIILQLGFETGAITTDIFFDFEDNSLQVDAAVVNYQIGEMVSLSQDVFPASFEVLLSRRQIRTHSFGYLSIIPSDSTGVNGWPTPIRVGSLAG